MPHPSIINSYGSSINWFSNSFYLCIIFWKHHQNACKYFHQPDIFNVVALVEVVVGAVEVVELVIVAYYC